MMGQNIHFKGVIWKIIRNSYLELWMSLGSFAIFFIDCIAHRDLTVHDLVMYVIDLNKIR